MAPGRFAAKAPIYGGWISLDFLGFSRKNLDLSMRYGGFSAEIFSSRLSLTLAALERDTPVLKDRRAEIHRATLLCFLFLRNLLSESFA